MAKTPTEVQKLAQRHTEEAIAVLRSIMADKSAPYDVRVKAATEVLNRGQGVLPSDAVHYGPVRNQYYVYTVHDGNGRLVYVGKGKNNRHLQSASRLNGRSRVRAEFGREIDALAFEERLIKRFKPRFNVVHNIRTDRVA